MIGISISCRLCLSASISFGGFWIFSAVGEGGVSVAISLSSTLWGIRIFLYYML